MDKFVMPPRLDLNDWQNRISKPVQLTESDLGTIGGLLNYLKRIQNDASLLKFTDIDLLLWQFEETGCSYASQFGGTPFVGPEFVWPVSRGDNLHFLGNLFFGDSIDLVGDDLPGDVLNIFLNDEDMERSGFYSCEWASSRSGNRLDANSVPKGTVTK